MTLLSLLRDARDNLDEVEEILDEIVRGWSETPMDNHSLAAELDYLVIQIGNVAESARDFKRHMVETHHWGGFLADQGNPLGKNFLDFALQQGGSDAIHGKVSRIFIIFNNYKSMKEVQNPMTFTKTDKAGTHKKSSAKYGVHSRSLIRISREKLESLNTLRLYCNFCKRWLPALAFYTQVAHSHSEASDDAVHLARYEVKAEGFKGRETVVICEDCAADIGQE
jgi:hypothetical protein